MEPYLFEGKIDTITKGGDLDGVLGCTVKLTNNQTVILNGQIMVDAALKVSGRTNRDDISEIILFLNEQLQGKHLSLIIQ